MSQIRHFLVTQTKCLYNHGQSILHHAQSRLVQQLPTSTNCSTYKTKPSSHHGHCIFNESRFGNRQLNRQNCYPTAIRSTLQKQSQQQKLEQRQLASSAINTLQRKRRKRAFAIENKYENEDCLHSVVKPPALKRQRSQQQQPPQWKEQSQPRNKRLLNSFGYHDAPHLKRRRRLSEFCDSRCKINTLVKDNNEHTRSYNNTSKNILSISNILSDVLNCLDFNEIFKLRRLSKFHEKEFYFKFGINKKLYDENFHLYFEYNNGYIVNILKKQISNNFLNIAMYSLQCINYKMGKWLIKNLIISPPNSIMSSNTDDDIMDIPHQLNLLSFRIYAENDKNDNKNDYIFDWSKNTQTILECGGNRHTSYFHTSSICNNVINYMFTYHGCRFKLHNENTFSFITHTQSNDNVDNCCSTGNSCNKSVCNSNFCSTGTGFIYSAYVNPFCELHSQIKQLKKQVSCLSFDINHMTEYMIIGNIYHIKPLCNTLSTLLHSNNSNCFRQTIMHKKGECFKIDNKNQRSWYKHNNHLMYLWNNMGLIKSSFSNTDKEMYIIEGRQSFFSDLSLKGDFSHYSKFLEVYDHYSTVLQGIEVLISMFLRTDLLDTFVFPSMYSIYTRQMLLCLLKPKTLLLHRQHLLDSMIPLNETEEFEFALYENPRYSPENRLKFLWKLLFSTKFSYSHNRAATNFFQDLHIELRHCINKLYNSFEYFAKEWELDKYESMKNDPRKQYQLYGNFRIIIQALFGFCDCYNRKYGMESGIYTIADLIGKKRDELIENSDSKNHLAMETDENFVTVNSFATGDIRKKFVNVLPRSELELHSLWKFMTKDIAEKKIAWCLQKPRFELIFHKLNQRQDSTNQIVFDAVKDIDLFVSNLWDIGVSLGCVKV